VGLAACVFGVAVASVGAHPLEAVAPPLKSSIDQRGSGVLKLEFASHEAAAAAAELNARQLGGIVLCTSGTGSMEPLIPARPTYVVVAKPSFETLKRSDLLVYMGRLDARRADRTCTLHRAVEHDRLGWLMSGDHNRWTESWDRVTPENYIGKVLLILEAPSSVLFVETSRAPGIHRSL
jgi:hypothetical protein